MDFAPSTVLNLKFSTILNAVPTTLAGTPAVSVYKNNSTTQSAAGVSLTVDFDSLTGMHNVNIDTSADGTFYAAGSQFQAVVTAGTVGGNSLIGFVIADFSLNFESPLRPTTAGQTIIASNLDAAVSSRLATSGYTAPDNADITAIKTKTDNLPASPASTTNITAGTITTVTNLTNAPTAGDFTATMKASLNASTPDVPTADEIAVATLVKDYTAISDGSISAKSLLQSSRSPLNGFSITPGTPPVLHVLKEDETTTAYTLDLTTDPTAEPIIGAS